jgi:DnaJ-class molecular chaperone
MKRVNVAGPGDDPDEYSFECPDCEGTKVVNVPVGSDERLTQSVTCPGCDGLGVIQGDASDALL